MRAARIAAAAVIVLGGAHLLLSRPRSALERFPIGIYGVESPEDLPIVKEAGFDSFVAEGPLPELAEPARALGLRMLAAPEPSGPAPSRRWPVDAWYLADEPDVNGVSPEALAGMSRRARAWDAPRAQVFTLGEGAQAARYGGLGDIVMLDWYPVPHLKLDSVADQLDAARRSLPPGKPLWMVLQAFDWRGEAQKDPAKPRVGRFPDHAEIRFMSHLAIIHGARGLFFFSFRRNGEALPARPELWQAVSRVSRELRILQPILEHGREISSPLAKEAGFESKAWRYRGRTYLIAANRTGKSAALPEELRKSWRALFEARSAPRESLKPCQATVLESRLSW